MDPTIALIVLQKLLVTHLLKEPQHYFGQPSKLPFFKFILERKTIHARRPHKKILKREKTRKNEKEFYVTNNLIGLNHSGRRLFCQLISTLIKLLPHLTCHPDHHLIFIHSLNFKCSSFLLAGRSYSKL